MRVHYFIRSGAPVCSTKPKFRKPLLEIRILNSPPWGLVLFYRNQFSAHYVLKITRTRPFNKQNYDETSQLLSIIDAFTISHGLVRGGRVWQLLTFQSLTCVWLSDYTTRWEKNLNMVDLGHGNGHCPQSNSNKSLATQNWMKNFAFWMQFRPAVTCLYLKAFAIGLGNNSPN